jgi:hypothetical protein
LGALWLSPERATLSEPAHGPSPQTPQQFPNSILADADPPRDLTMRNAQALEPLNQPLSCSGQTRAATRIVAGLSLLHLAAQARA